MPALPSPSWLLLLEPHVHALPSLFRPMLNAHPRPREARGAIRRAPDHRCRAAPRPPGPDAAQPSPGQPAGSVFDPVQARGTLVAMAIQSVERLAGGQDPANAVLALTGPAS